MARQRWFDPAEFETRMLQERKEAPKTKIALGLDLGTNTGVAVATVEPGRPFTVGSRPIILGQWDLSAGPYDSGALRFLKLKHLLTVTQPDVIFYEDVKHTPPVAFGKSIAELMGRAMTSAVFFGALRGVLTSWAEENGVPCAALPIGAIKQRGTGRGNANKADMIKACNAELGTEFDPETYETTGVDNVVDAAFCMLLGLEQFGG